MSLWYPEEENNGIKWDASLNNASYMSVKKFDPMSLLVPLQFTLTFTLEFSEVWLALVKM